MAILVIIYSNAKSRKRDECFHGTATMDNRTLSFHAPVMSTEIYSADNSLQRGDNEINAV